MTRIEALWRAAREQTDVLRRHDALSAASAIAFHAFFTLVPLVAISGWVAHELTSARAKLMEPLLALAPGPVAILADESFMRLSDTGAAVMPPLSIAGFLWLASGGVSVAMRVFERIFEAPRRPFPLRRLIALGFVLLSVAVLSLATAAIVLGVRLGSLGSWVAGIAVPFAALWLLVASFFRLATRRGAGAERSGFRGAMVTLLLWCIVSLGFSFYVRQLASYSEFYGGVAAVVVILVWLWLMALALVVGGEVNARFERQAPSSRSSPGPKSQRAKGEGD